MSTTTNPTNPCILCFYIFLYFIITSPIIIIYKTGGGGGPKKKQRKKIKKKKKKLFISGEYISLNRSTIRSPPCLKNSIPYFYLTAANYTYLLHRKLRPVPEAR